MGVRQEELWAYCLAFLLGVIAVDLVFDTCGDTHATLLYYKHTHGSQLFSKILVPSVTAGLAVVTIQQLRQETTSWKNWLTFCILIAAAPYFAFVMAPNELFLIEVNAYDKSAFEADEVVAAMQATKLGHVVLMTVLSIALALHIAYDEPPLPGSCAVSRESSRVHRREDRHAHAHAD
jgi:hypothetical protein